MALLRYLQELFRSSSSFLKLHSSKSQLRDSIKCFLQMALKLLRFALLVACLFIGIVSATRFSDITKRKGYGPNAKKRASNNNGGGSSHTKFRFLTKATQRQYNSNE